MSRRAAVLGVALCVVAQTAGVAHFELVPHVICADHGELVDVVVHPTVSGDPDDGAVKRIGFHLPGQASLAGADEHCALAQLLRQLMPVVASPIVVSRPGWREQVAELRAAVPALPLLHLAPKQSPPATLA